MFKTIVFAALSASMLIPFATGCVTEHDHEREVVVEKQQPVVERKEVIVEPRHEVVEQHRETIIRHE